MISYNIETRGPSYFLERQLPKAKRGRKYVAYLYLQTSTIQNLKNMERTIHEIRKRGNECDQMHVHILTKNLNTSQLKMLMSFFNFLNAQTKDVDLVTVNWVLEDKHKELVEFFLSEVWSHYHLKVGLADESPVSIYAFNNFQNQQIA